MTRKRPKQEKETMNKANVLKLALLLCAAACSIITGTLLAFFGPEAPSNLSQRTLTFAERVAYQRAIEEVYWRHRIWPKDRPDSKPSLDEVMSQAQIEKKVEDYLRDSQALGDYWQRPITPDQLQAEMERMASNTKQPEVLRELFEALGNDPFVVAECLARPVVAERLVNSDPVAAGVSPAQPTRLPPQKLIAPVTMAAVSANYALPAISGQSDNWTPSGLCTDDTWTATSLTNAPVARSAHTAVWTGSEMIIWGGTQGGVVYLNTGGRYNPSTDSWTATSLTNAPAARDYHTAIWTHTEMLDWGGFNGSSSLNTGGRYDPGTNSWTATSTTNAPAAIYPYTALFRSEMMIGGGTQGGVVYLNTGGRYNPSTDSWTATSIINAPGGRAYPTAVWTGSQMIVRGGFRPLGPLNTGGRYCAAVATPTPTPTSSPTATSTPTPTASPTPTATPTVTPTATPTATATSTATSTPTATPTPTAATTATPSPTPTPTSTPRPTPTPRLAPTPRPRPTPAPRP